mgnify:CR=1 FL=1
MATTLDHQNFRRALIDAGNYTRFRLDALARRILDVDAATAAGLTGADLPIPLAPGLRDQIQLPFAIQVEHELYLLFLWALDDLTDLEGHGLPGMIELRDGWLGDPPSQLE